MLAYERRNSSSFWRPYLDTVSPRPSAGWCMRSQESANALKQLGTLCCQENSYTTPIAFLESSVT